MSKKQISLGPFNKGKDNIHNIGDDEFQKDRLYEALDIDIKDDGWIINRSGLSKISNIISPLSGFSNSSFLLVQDGGILYSADPELKILTEITSGLDEEDPMRYVYYDSQIWWCNKDVIGRIGKDKIIANWGQTNPATPTLGTIMGILPAGRYQVVCTTIDNNGIESGCGVAAAITLDGTEAITVDLDTYDTNAVSVRVYVASLDTGGRGAFLLEASDTTANLPITVASIGNSRYDLRTQYLRGPITGRVLGLYKDMLMIARGPWLAVSSEVSPHLFRLGWEVMYFEANVQAIAGLESGLFVATEEGMWWVTGNTLETMDKIRIDREAYARDCIVVDGWKLPSLQTTGRIALFANAHGFFAGMPDGLLRPLTQGYELGDVSGKKFSVAYRNASPLRQFFFLLTDAIVEDEDYWASTEPASPNNTTTPDITTIAWNFKTTATNTTAADRDYWTLQDDVVITLPASPQDGDVVAVSNKTYIGATVDGNGYKVANDLNAFEMNVANRVFMFTWVSISNGWDVSL